jgi:universal stress protein A
MLSLNRILFATDFSESAGTAREMARLLSSRFESELHMLHVVSDLSLQVPEFGMGLSFPSFADATAEHRREMKERTEASLDAEVDPAWLNDHPVITAVRFGTPFLEIIRYAREHDIDLIVLGSHGRTGIAHVLLGSVAERVVRKAPCPVLTVRPTNDSDEDADEIGRFGVHPLPVG